MNNLRNLQEAQSICAGAVGCYGDQADARGDAEGCQIFRSD
jgi:hypothetical protein